LRIHDSIGKFFPELLSGAIIFLVFGIYFLIWQNRPGILWRIDDLSTLFFDFIYHYYPMGQHIFDTKLPVQGFYYSPFFAFFLFFFARLPLPLATLAWGAWQMLAIFFLAIIPFRYFWRQPRGHAWFALYLILLCLSFPVLHNLVWGQVSVTITLGILATLSLARRNYPKMAAVLLALCTAIKYYPIIFAGACFFSSKKMFSLTYLIALALFFIVIPDGLLGRSATNKFYMRNRTNLDYVEPQVLANINSQYFPLVLLRTIGSPISPGRLIWLKRLGLLIILGNALFLMRQMGSGQMDLESAFILMFLSLPFGVITSWPHYFVYLPFCQVSLLRRYTRVPQTGVLFWVGLGCIVSSILASNILYFCFSADWMRYVFFGTLFWANLLLLFSFYGQYILGRPMLAGKYAASY
jgi:hypothetical protein